jgi:hypothetical protein
MHGRADQRGQALAELVLLWLAVAAVLAVLATAVIASGAASLITAGLTNRPPQGLGPRAEQALERSLAGGGLTPLAAAALAERELGPRAAAELIRRRLLVYLAGRGGLFGELDVTRLVTAAPGLSLRAVPAGPAVVVAIATSADEPAEGGVGLEQLGGDAPDGVAAALAAGGRGVPGAARLVSRLASAFDVAGAILSRLDAPVPGPPAGRRAGDVIFCRPYRAYWYRGSLRAYEGAMGDLWRVAVLRDGRLIADRIVTERC